METAELYQEAEKADIPVSVLHLPENGSMCIQAESGRCYIALDNALMGDEVAQRIHLAHELGHCKTGSFYNRWAARDVRQKHEHRADKWAIQQLIPESALDEAVAEGYTDLRSLAEHFRVTEDFVRKAVCWYTYGNLAVECYF